MSRLGAYTAARAVVFSSSKMQNLILRVRARLAESGFRTMVILFCAGQGLLMSGCWIPTMAGMMVESYKRTSTRSVEPDYVGMQGKSYAVCAPNLLVVGEQP